MDAFCRGPMGHPSRPGFPPQGMQQRPPGPASMPGGPGNFPGGPPTSQVIFYNILCTYVCCFLVP